MILGKNAKRICVYFVYDPQGVIDEYIICQLKDLKQNLNYLLVVSNGKLREAGKEKLRGIADEILERKNSGFDVWAYKAGIEHISYDVLKNYDELLLMNFTCFGPFYPFSECFEAMAGRDLDFWGMTKYYQNNEGEMVLRKQSLPEHIQSYFIAVRKTMFSSPSFRKYWYTRPKIKSYVDAIVKHEIVFTKTFTGLGFNCDVYVKCDDMLAYTYHPVLYDPLKLVKEKRCPIVKRKSFTFPYEITFYQSAGEYIPKLFNFIKANFTVHADMILDNLLRLENISELKKTLQLNFVLPRDYVIPAYMARPRKKIALFFHFYFEGLLEWSMRYIRSMPEYADIYVTVCGEEKKALISAELQKTTCNFKVIIVQNRGRDVSALLVNLREYVSNYEYVCVAHDKKFAFTEPVSQGASYWYQCLENTLAGKAFVENVINTFEDNPRLGILCPPQPIHGIYSKSLLGNEWGDNFESSKQLLNDLNINILLNRDMPVLTIGGMLWFRPRALQKLFAKNWKYEDFPPEPLPNDGQINHAIERSYSFIAQDAGFYTGHILSEEFAKYELNNLYSLARKYKIETVAMRDSFLNPVWLAKRVLKKILPKKIWNMLRKLKRRK